MDEDNQLLARVLKQEKFLEAVLLNDTLEDWNLAKELGEFLLRVFPEDIVGHALLLRAFRHTGNLTRAAEELTACRGFIERQELTPKQLDLFLPILQNEDRLLRAAGGESDK
jgi:hypothetical protein